MVVSQSSLKIFLTKKIIYYLIRWSIQRCIEDKGVKKVWCLFLSRTKLYEVTRASKKFDALF